jgi:hypothetical protein
MKHARRRQLGRSGLELSEEAIHLVRTAPMGTLTAYYFGAVPFVLATLFFWADMSRSALAGEHLAGGALGVALLFLWMKFWQAVFAGNLRAALAGEPVPRMSFSRCRRILVTQMALQPIGLFLLPLAAVAMLPFGWVYAFYQNVTALADGEPQGLRALTKRAMRQAAFWPGQNHVALLVLSAFGLCVWLNWGMVCFLLPGLAKALLGVESIFTRSEFSMLNTTFFAVVFGLTYLSVDPILKALYVLRCFYGESLHSGEDLKAELRRFAAAAVQAAACVALALSLMTPFTGQATERPEGWSANLKSAAAQRLQPAIPDEGGIGVRGKGGCAVQSAGARTFLSAARRSGLEMAASSEPADDSGVAADKNVRAPSPAAAAIPSTPLKRGVDEKPAAQFAPSLSPPELDRTIQQVMQQRKYAWRLPREKVVETEDTQQGIIARFLEKIGTWIKEQVVKCMEWLVDWLDKLFRSQRTPTPSGGSGYGWILAQELLLYGLIAAVVIGLALFGYRIWRNRRRRSATIDSEPIRSAPDLTDENVGAEQLPEDSWTKLARELLERGEWRLALRAFYLASLAHLAARNLISLAKFKSNRDYERELGRRGHSFPELLALFGDNVSVFERIWYGMHEINAGLVNQFAANVERIRGGVLIETNGLK